MGVAYRDMKPGEFDDTVDLINYAFGFQAQDVLAKAYAPAPVPVLPSRHKVAVDERTGRLLAAIGVYPQTVHVGGRTLNVAFLGCVAVHPRARGEGHMRRLMDLWRDELARRGDVDLIALWGLRHRYAHFGFTPAGYDYTYTVNDSCAKHALVDVADTDCASIAFRPLFAGDGDVELAVRLNESRPVYADRDPRCIDRIDSYLNAEPLAVLRGGRPIGVLIRARMDHTVVRELSLDDPVDAGVVAKAYLGALHDCGKTSFTLRVSPTDAALNERFSAFSEEVRIGSLCKCDVLDYAKLLECYLPVVRRLWRMEPGRLSLVLDGQPVTVTVGDGVPDDGASDGGVRVERRADPDAPRLGKMDAQELLMGMNARYRRDLPQTPAGWFPLPMCWYWPDLN